MPADNQKLLFNYYPLAIAAACFSCGILIAHAIQLFALIISVVCGLFMLCATTIFFQRRKFNFATLCILISFTCAGAASLILERKSIDENRVRRFYDENIIASGDPVELTGVVERMPEPAPDGFFLTLRVERLRARETERTASGYVRLFAPVRDRAALARYENLELRHGARMRVMTGLRRADNFRNPGTNRYTEYLERRGLDAVGTIKTPLVVERLDDERVFLPLVWLYERRARMLAEIGRLFSTDAAGILNATLLGNRYGLTRETAERFREGGTFHVIVVSGLHVTFIGGIALIFARRLTKRQVWQFAGVVLFVWSYALAVGAESSVVRAALMFSFAAAGPRLFRRTTALNALGAACIVLLVWRPGDLFDPSFQLTFASVLAITVVAWPIITRLREVGAWHPTRETPYPPASPRWFRTLGEILFWSERKWRGEMEKQIYDYRLAKHPFASRLENVALPRYERFNLQRLIRYAIAALIVSACVQIFLLPFTVVYFHRFSVAGLVLNIWVGALMAALCLIALMALVIAQLSAWLASPFVWTAEAINWTMTHSVDPFLWFDAAQLRIPEYTGGSAIVYALYYLPLVFLLVALAHWQPLQLPPKLKESSIWALAVRAAAVAFVILFAIIIAHPGSAHGTNGNLRVDFIDVGQGDSVLVTMPDGTTLLIDGGGQAQFGSFDNDEDSEAFQRDQRGIGERVVAEYLWWRGLDRVDYILATHADTDHIEGLNDIARMFTVRSALVARTPTDDPEYALFAETLARSRIPVETINRGDTLRFGEVSAEILWPARAASASAPSRNDDSIVLRLRFRNQTILFTGDIESVGERALIGTGDDLRSDVVKVAHHGSRTSSSELFVGASRPALAVISVALPSPYNHPHPEVIERWRAAGAQVLTTGEQGMISIISDGREFAVETFINN
jgi:competence protein ComEC